MTNRSGPPSGRARSMTALALLAGAAASLAACGDTFGEAGGESSRIVVDRAPVAVDDPDLVQVADVRTDREGRTWVLTRHPPLVRIYDADGRRTAAFGEPGGGPAEFGEASILVEGHEDGVGVVDSRRETVRYYAPDGTLLEERSLESGVFLPAQIREVYFGDLGWSWRVEGGFLQDRYPPPPQGMPMQMQQAWDFWAAELVFVPDDGGEPRSLVRLSDFSDFSHEEPPTPRPLSAGPLWDLCPGDELALHTGAAGEVVRFGVDGRVRHRSAVDLPLDPPSRDLVVDWMVSVISGTPDAPDPEILRERAGMIAELAEPTFEPTLPPTRLRCDSEGRVWIQLFDLENDTRGYGREWVVVEPEGRVAAEVVFPPRFHPLRFGPDRVVGVIRDALDVETVGWVPTPALP
jgi:hypothetical protein